MNIIDLTFMDFNKNTFVLKNFIEISSIMTNVNENTYLPAKHLNNEISQQEHLKYFNKNCSIMENIHFIMKNGNKTLQYIFFA